MLDIIGTCKGHLRDMFETFVGHFRDMKETYMEMYGGSLGTRQGYLRFT